MLDILAHNAPSVFWVCSPSLDKMQYASPAYEDIWGRSCESLYDNPLSFTDAIHSDDRQGVLEHLKNGAGKGWDVEYRIVRPDGTIRWIHDVGDPVPGRPLMAGVATDVTERLSAQRALQNAHDVLERTVEARTRELNDANARLTEDIARREKAEEALREQEAFIRLVMDTIPAWVSYLDDDFRYRLANKRYEELGFAPGSMVHRHPADVIGEEAFAKAEPYMRLALAGEAVNYENAIEAGGRERRIAVTHIPDRNAHGIIRGIFNLAVDVTEQNEAERRMVEALAANRAMESILRAGLEGGEMDVIAERALGAVLDLPWLAEREASGCLFLHDEGDRRLKRIAERGPSLDDCGDCHTVEPGFCMCGQAARDGVVVRSEVPHAQLCVPVMSEERLLGVLSVMSRAGFGESPEREAVLSALARALALVIQRRRAEEGHQATLDALARSNAELEHFAYAISHDLQEPLRIVASYGKIIEERADKGLDKENREFLGYMIEGAGRMNAMIRDLLSLSRVDTMGRPFEAIDMNLALDEALANLSVSIDGAGARVVRGALPELDADMAQMARLFQNLVGNAVKYARPGVLPEIRISADKAGEEWAFTVADNGIGVEPRHFDKIFMAFQRLHSREDFEGSGIGLALCRKIVERHGGRITVDSTPGEGSAFRFTLPAARLEN